MPKYIPYGRQKIDEDDIEAVIQVLRSPLITQGPIGDEFEARVAEYCGAQFAVTFNSGTSALHAAMYAANVGPGDEVITSPLTFAASANAALYRGAWPVFADVDRDSYCIDVAKLESAITRKTRAIVPVDFAGYPVNMVRIKDIAQDHGLVVVEDAAHALGACRGDVMVGQEADMTMFSFHPVKHITTGEGGMIVCNDKNYYHKLRLFRSHGIERDEMLWHRNDGPWYYEMQELGYNFRMTDIQAALGLSQLGKITEFLQVRRRIASRYDEALSGVSWLQLPAQPDPDYKHAYHIYPILLDHGIDRKDFFNYMRSHQIGVQVHYIPVPLQPYYQQNYGFRPGDFPIAEDIYAREVSIPIFSGMGEAEQSYVIDIIMKYR